MARNAGSPSAWDDDWETLADKAAVAEKKQEQQQQKKDKDKLPTRSGASSNAPAAGAQPVILSRAERLARHEEENRRLWKSACVPFLSPFGRFASSLSKGERSNEKQ